MIPQVNARFLKFLPKKFQKSWKNHKVRNVAALSAAVLIFFSAIMILWASSWRVPALDTIESRKVSQSTKIYDRTGEILLYDVFQDIKRTVVPFEEISNNIKIATLAIEDNDFYQHSGIKPLAFLRAMIVNLSSLSFSQGGSTITQQVVKNSLLTGEKRISRKLKEWVLAVKLERILSKEQIFGMYLNEIPYGGNLYGVEEASQAFFGKKSSAVTLAEAAYLAALPKAPTFYSPYRKNKEKLDERKNLVLREMLQNKFITKEEYDKALAEKVEFRPQEEFGIKAPHFVLYVKDLLEQKYGEQVLQEGGLKVITTLDYELQKKSEDLAKEYAKENKKTFDAENLSTVALDPKTGDILALVGSRDYFDDEIDGNFNVALAHRQPGSTFKPFAYAVAFNKGFTPSTVVFDLKTEFSARCTPDGTPRSASTECYMPENYDHVFRGPVTMREALAQSINVPSIKTLYLAGIKETLRLAKDMGIESLTDVNQYGLTLVLGGGEVSLLDITSAYGVFANDGIRVPYRAIIEIKDQNGRIIDKPAVTGSRVLAEETARTISDILSDEAARAPAFGLNSPLQFPGRDVAAKTGTTNDYRDAWVIGYSPTVVVGAWAGNNNNRPMERTVARYIIAPFWNQIMTEALKRVPDENFVPANLSYPLDLKPILRGQWKGGGSVLIDRVSGGRATPETPPELIDEILLGGVHSILYWVDKDDPRGPPPELPGADPQFESWEYGVQKWAAANGYYSLDESAIPVKYDDVHTAQNAPILTVIKPSPNEKFQKTDKIFVSTSAAPASSQFQISKFEFFLNNQIIGSTANYPFLFSFIPADVSGLENIQAGMHELRVVVYDNVLNKKEVIVPIEII